MEWCFVFENKVLRRDIYHLSKRFYHEHEVNEAKDCTLKAFVSSEKVDLTQKDHACLVDMLLMYHEAFQSYARQISERNRENKESELRIEKMEFAEGKKKEYAKAYIGEEQSVLKENLYQINGLCENALMEYTYYQTLYCSPCNSSFTCETVSMDEKYRRMALNVENSIRYIKAIQVQAQNVYYRLFHRKHKESQSLIEAVQCAGEQSTELGKFGFWVAIVVAWIPVLIELFMAIGKCDKKQITVEKIITAVGVTIVARIFFNRFKKKHKKVFSEEN